MSTIHPVLPSGGSGTRLWPLSRAAYPKQLLPLCGRRTMLHETLARAAALARHGLDVEAPLLICDQEHRFPVREQCTAVSRMPAAIYLEPAGLNTAPAIARDAKVNLAATVATLGKNKGSRKPDTDARADEAGAARPNTTARRGRHAKT